MKRFESSEQLKKVLGGFFEDFSKRMQTGDPAVMGPAQDLNATRLVVHFELKDPDLRIVIDCEEKPIHISYGSENPKPPTAVFYVSADAGHRFWLGGLNLPNALLKKQVVLKGPVGRLLKVLPITKKVYPLYDQFLVDHGHDQFRLQSGHAEK